MRKDTNNSDVAGHWKLENNFTDSHLSKKTIAVVFAYDELNINVLTNAMIWKAKQHEDLTFIAYTPPGFQGLFFAADFHVEIPDSDNSFFRYSEVLEDLTPSLNFTRKVEYKFWNFLIPLIIRVSKSLKIKDRNVVRVVTIFQPHSRQRKYLINSGVWEKCKRDFESKCKRFGYPNPLIYPANHILRYSDSQLRFGSKSLMENFEYLFKVLYESIEIGLIDRFVGSRFLSPPPDHQKCNKKVIVLRTRNFNKKQPIHNSTEQEIVQLSLNLLNRGISIKNIGNPALSIISSIPSSLKQHYREFNNILSINEELYEIGSPIITRADAGLFTLMACLPFPLHCLTAEWSSFFDVNLLEARRLAGHKFDSIRGESEDQFVLSIVKSLEGQQR
jgi:hypothetical protein